MSPIGRGDFLVAHWEGRLSCRPLDRVGRRGLRPCTLPHHRTYRFRYPAVGVTIGLSFRFSPPLRLDLRPSGLPGSTLGPSVPGPGRPPRPAVGGSCDPADESTIGPVRLLRSFVPPALPGFFATMTSADFSKALTLEISPSKVLPLSPRAARLYLMRLDGIRVSLFLASSPPAPGLDADSCSCGRGFAFRFLQLHLTATPCGSAKVGSITSFGIFHPLETAHVGHTRGDFLVACASPLLKIRRPEGVEGESVEWGLRPPCPPGRRQESRRSTPPNRRQESRRSHKEKGATAGAVAPFRWIR